MADSESTSSDISFEHLMERLESLVDRLESGELSLEQALTAYQEGVGLARAGHERLTAAERRIEEVARGGQISVVAPSEILEPEEPT
ncbi:MAG: exodeoxyribonuclease VII small subunit [Myxococcota bacterium]